MVQNVVVKRANINDLKTNLSRYLVELKPSDVLVLCKNNKPVAEIRLLPKEKIRKPRIGVAKGQFVVPNSFFEQLPKGLMPR